MRLTVVHQRFGDCDEDDSCDDEGDDDGGGEDGFGFPTSLPEGEVFLDEKRVKAEMEPEVP